MGKILIVEDEPAISDLILMNLTMVGHTAVQAFDSGQAIEAIKSQSFDLCLLDVMLPGQDGFAIIDKFTPCQYVPDVKLEVTESSIGDYPATRITLRSGQEWNSTISHYYLFKTDNSSYLIMSQYFLEAEEGYGARIEAMLSSFQEN